MHAAQAEVPGQSISTSQHSIGGQAKQQCSAIFSLNASAHTPCHACNSMQPGRKYNLHAACLAIAAEHTDEKECSGGAEQQDIGFAVVTVLKPGI